MHFHIQHLLHHYGYFGVFFILLAEMIGVPFPAETTLILSGVEWTNHVFNLFPLLLAASFGNIAGSSVAYTIGRFLGRPVIVRFGKYVGITTERLDQANKTFHQYQNKVILFGKFIAGIRVLVPYLAGINKMPVIVFSVYNAISAVIWAGMFIFLGKYIGIEWTKYHHLLHRYMVPTIVVVLLIAGAYFAWKYRQRKNEMVVK